MREKYLLQYRLIYHRYCVSSGTRQVGMLHSLNHYREYFNRVQYTSMYNNYTLGAILGAIYRDVFKYILIIQ